MEGLALLQKNCTFLDSHDRGLRLYQYSMLTMSCPSDPYMGAGNDLCDVNKIADVVLFLCSDSAQVVNGAMWTADGGVTAA